MAAGARLEAKSGAACALASWRDQLVVAWTGTDLHVNLATSVDGRSLAGARRLRERTYRQQRRNMDSDSMMETRPLAPALAADGDRLHLAWTDGNWRPNLLAAERADAGPVTLRQRSLGAPALAVPGWGGLALAWTGTDGRVNVAYGAAPWESRPATLRQARSHTGPALCGHAGGLTAAWVGTDRRVNLLTVTDSWEARPLRLDEARSGARPALCAYRGGLAVAWTGGDRRVNVLTLAGGRLAAPLRLDDVKSDAAPALCTHRGSLLLAWAGTDRHVNLVAVG